MGYGPTLMNFDEDGDYDETQPKEQEFTVWEDKDGQGLAQVEVNSMSSFHDIFSCALQRQKVAHTSLNNISSRSHRLLVIAISSPYRDSVGHKINGKLNLIDLAGNEDNRRTCNDGIHLQESAKINLSLFALSNNPGEYQESVHTVSLAVRSHHISNFVSAQKNTTPMVKVDMEAKLRAWLESKGKTKSAQKMAGLRSPFTGRTPSSLNSAMKLNSEVKFVTSNTYQFETEICEEAAGSESSSGACNMARDDLYAFGDSEVHIFGDSR
ncbi:unnamed protein product [Fraxinus pennsylvanica]|uniref:Kinesin-like protein n=1 Tax=Fraxinus pennsylvanica TaxID=56036 RepID=A0AAD2A7U6_9LAMI|nr:unnamed protein product [Fraxinus pennsylvanica]